MMPSSSVGSITRFLLGLASIWVLTSCASISVEPGTEYATAKKPDKIYVTLFQANRGDFRVDREGAELKTFKKDLQLMLQAAQVADLSRRLIHAEPTRKHDGIGRQNAWLLRGEFVRVNQGSRFLRGAIGFGAGGTKVVTRVEVYDLGSGNPKPFLTFLTTGGSNAEPGAITAIATDPLEIAIQVAVGAGGGLAHGLTEDTKRTAREITAQLSDYLYRSKWITEDEWIQPKTYVPPGASLN